MAARLRSARRLILPVQRPRKLRSAKYAVGQPTAVPVASDWTRAKIGIPACGAADTAEIACSM
jgi:hypothetical protein